MPLAGDPDYYNISEILLEALKSFELFSVSSATKNLIDFWSIFIFGAVFYVILFSIWQSARLFDGARTPKIENKAFKNS